VEPTEVVRRIHATAPQLVYEFAGAGSLALWWLHSEGGSSRTILEATDRYSPPSMASLVGYLPERFTSAETAGAMARAAFDRARTLGAEHTPVLGVGLSATIATDRAKRGEHRMELAVHDAFGTSSYSLTLTKGKRSREAEESLISHLVLHAIASASGVLGVPLPQLLPGEELTAALEPSEDVRAFVDAKSEWLLLQPDGGFSIEPPAGIAILSGAFNPVHAGHWQLAQAAGELLGRPVVFEIPLRNADKEPFDMLEARRRAAQFLGRAPVLLSKASLFGDKAKLFPGAPFVVGVDTAQRILESRFYGSEAARDESLEGLRSLGNSFLVAGRLRNGVFRSLGDLEVPARHRDLFTELPAQRFRADISSTQVREGWMEGSA